MRFCFRYKIILFVPVVTTLLLVGCGMDETIAPETGFQFNATITSASASSDLERPITVQDRNPLGTIAEAFSAGNLVLVQGLLTKATVSGAVTFVNFVTFPLPDATELPATFTFDDGMSQNPRTVGRFDILEQEGRDEHESLPRGEQPASRGIIRVDRIEGEIISGSFDFRAAVIEPTGERGDELLDVTGSFNVRLSAGSVVYTRNGQPIVPNN